MHISSGNAGRQTVKLLPFGVVGGLILRIADCLPEQYLFPSLDGYFNRCALFELPWSLFLMWISRYRWSASG